MNRKMKKLGLLAFSALTLSVSTNHFASGQTVNFGLKGGFNWSSINDEQRVADSKVKPRPGFHAGGLAHIHLNDDWALQPEVMYSKEGAKYEGDGKSDLNFVNVPVLVQYMVGKGFRVETGPQVGLITSAKYENLNNEESDKGEIQKGNVSWAFGLGYLTDSGLGFDARLNLGLSNIYVEGAYPGQSARTRVGQFGIFYQFK